jgi:hypothetical protein
LEADQKARAAKHAKEAAATKAADTKEEGATKEEARAELAHLRNEESEAAHKLADTAAKIKAGDCATTNADTLKCE